MKKLQIAILEDNIELRHELESMFKNEGIANVIVSHHDASLFIADVKRNFELIDLLFVDIELEGQNKNGIDVALILKKPVVFASGILKEHLDGIESLNLDSSFPVEAILKPSTPDKLKKVISKISDEIEWVKNKEKLQKVKLKINDVLIEIDQSNVSFIESIPDNSNNKIIYFIDRPPAILHNFSFAKMLEKGFNQELFVKTHSSYRVNKKFINERDCLLKPKKVNVSFMDKYGKVEQKEIPISENYYNAIKTLLSK